MQFLQDLTNRKLRVFWIFCSAFNLCLFGAFFGSLLRLPVYLMWVKHRISLAKLTFDPFTKVHEFLSSALPNVIVTYLFLALLLNGIFSSFTEN